MALRSQPWLKAIAETEKTSGASANTTFNLPDNCATGDLLLAVIRCADASTASFPGSPSWTEIESDNTDDGSDDVTTVAYRFVDGTEGWSGTGNTITITAGSAGKSCGQCWRFSQVDTGSAPEIGTAATGNSSTPNPGSVTPSDGTNWYGFLGIITFDARQNYSSGHSNKYSSHDQTDSGDGPPGTSDCRCIVGNATRYGTSQNYGATTLTGSTNQGWTAWGAAVYGLEETDRPQITSAAGTASSSAATNATVNIPDSIASGDLIVMCLRKDGEMGGNLDATSSPAFTHLDRQDDGSSDEYLVCYRYADGTEGWSGASNTKTVTGSTSSQYAAQVVVLVNADSGTPPEISTVAEGSSTSPAPSAVSPSVSDGSQKQTFLGFYCWEGGDAEDSDYADYSDTPSTTVNNHFDHQAVAESAGSTAAIASCAVNFLQPDSAQSSQALGTFELASSASWAAWTVVVFGESDTTTVTPSTVSITAAAVAPGAEIVQDSPSAVGITAAPVAAGRAFGVSPNVVSATLAVLGQTEVVQDSPSAVGATLEHPVATAVQGIGGFPDAVALVAAIVAPKVELLVQWSEDAPDSATWTEDTPDDATWTEEVPGD